MPIPSITSLPPAPVRSDSTTFESRADALMTALPTMVTELNTANDAVDAAVIAAEAEADAAAASAAASANSAAAALASENAAAVNANAGIWISGTTYSIGNVRFSPTTYQSYRRKTNGAGTTDPASDTTNWAVVFGAPSQTGNGGKYLSTDGTTPSWSAIPGMGGATSSGSVTLTSSSAGSQRITTTSAGQSVTLPNATTCVKGAALFNISNNGPYFLIVKNSAGTELGAVRPNDSAVVALTDNSTSAGVWSGTGLAYYYSDVDIMLPSSINYTNSATLAAITLDATRTCVLIAGETLYAVVYDHAANTRGNVTTVRSANASGKMAAKFVSTDKVLVVSTSGQNIEAVCLTFTGTTITVGTAASATATDIISSINAPVGYPDSSNGLVAVGSSYVFSYVRATATGVRAVTVSGTTCTIGSEFAPAGTYAVNIAEIDSTKILVISHTYQSQISAVPVTVSGTTLTGGTAATMSLSTTGDCYMIRAIGTRWAILYKYDSTYMYASLVSVSGTTATVSTVTNVMSGPTNYGVCHVIGSQFIWVISSSSSYNYAYLFTDTSGTLSLTNTLTLNGSANNAVMGFAYGASDFVVGYLTSSGAYNVFKLGIVSNTISILDSLPVVAPGASTSFYLIGSKTYKYASGYNPGSDLAGYGNRHSSSSLNLIVNTVGRLYATPELSISRSASGAARVSDKEMWMFMSTYTTSYFPPNLQRWKAI